MPNVETVLVIVAVMFFLSITASKLSSRFGVPALIFFAIIGMLAGSDGPGGIYFDHPWVTQFIGVLALTLILFAAGMETDTRSLRPVLWPGTSLATAGVAFSAVLVGAFAHLLLHWTLLESLLLGAIISSTDAAAVFDVLRSRHLRLRGNLNQLIELESGGNDPMAVLLTILLIAIITNPATSYLDIALKFIWQFVGGAALGYLFGRIASFLINRIKLEWEGLYPVLSVTMALVAYSATAKIGANGFLATYIAGLVLGRGNLIHRTTLRVFHDGLAWLMQIAMFIVLGLQVFPSRLPGITLVGLGIALFLMFVARPVSVFTTLIGFRISLREKLFVSWAGLRGAAPIILATFPQLAGIGRSDVIFHIVFFVALTSLLLQGTTLALFARLLGLESPVTSPRAFPFLFDPAVTSDGQLIEFHVGKGTQADEHRVMDLNLPSGVLLLSVSRGQELIVPQGGTTLRAGDTALVLVNGPTVETIREIFESAAKKN